VALEVIQSAWPVVVGAIVLATLACFRVLASFSQREIDKHNIVVEAREMRQQYLQSRVSKLPTSDWEIVE
jgi:hypothetical protein